MSEVTIEIPTCHCGVQMSLNPHPEAGKTETLCEVGATFVCIPCCVKSRHVANQRKCEAQRNLDGLKASVGRMYREVSNIGSFLVETNSIEGRLKSILARWKASQ